MNLSWETIDLKKKQTKAEKQKKKKKPDQSQKMKNWDKTKTNWLTNQLTNQPNPNICLSLEGWEKEKWEVSLKS